MSGSLVIVGTGIRMGQTTLEAVGHIEQADKVLFLATDPVTINWLHQLNTTAESLDEFYSFDKERLTTYQEMARYILSFVRNGMNVCVAFYGHPGVFVYPSHEAVRIARNEGYSAKMLPGISAEDCLFADLGIDPGRLGCQSFEATDFLIYRRSFDSASHLILWQIGVLGDIGYHEQHDHSKLRMLSDRLEQSYPGTHQVVIYEAARYPGCDPHIEHVALHDLAEAHISPISTLCVPPLKDAYPDLDMLKQLGIPESYIKRRANPRDMAALDAMVPQTA